MDFQSLHGSSQQELQFQGIWGFDALSWLPLAPDTHLVLRHKHIGHEEYSVSSRLAGPHSEFQDIVRSSLNKTNNLGSLQEQQVLLTLSHLSPAIYLFVCLFHLLTMFNSFSSFIHSVHSFIHSLTTFNIGKAGLQLPM